MFREEKPGKIYNLYWFWSYTQTFLSWFFILISFDITPQILLVKISFIWNCKSVKVTDSGGPIFVCRWASVNVLVKINSVLQFIYWASIYLLKVTDGNTRFHILLIQTHFTSCSSVFSVFIVVFEQVKFRLGSKSHCCKKTVI